MVRLIYGGVGTGKSTYVIDNIIEDLKAGRKPLLIVPDQHVLTAEREIADRSEDISTIDLEVLSFRRVANHVFRALGGLSFNDIDDSGRMLIMWRVLRESKFFLKAYSEIDEKNNSFTELMLSTVNELKQYSITPIMLENASKKLKESHIELSYKLEDIALIYSMYQSFLSKEYNDPTDELTRVAELLSGNDFFSEFNVYFDSFDSFTPQQFSVIEQIIKQAKNVGFTLCYDPTDKSGVFSSSQRTYKSILKLLKKLDVEYSDVYLKETRGNKAHGIDYVSRNLWNHNVLSDEYSGDTAGIETICCHDKFEECEAVTADILKKVRHGVRYKDIVIIARDINSYEGIIDNELENNGVPFYMSRRTDLSSKPIFKLILAAFAIKNKGWRYNDVISYIKTGLVGVTFEECDILENYASAWNIKGRRWYDGIDWNMNPDGFTEKITDDGIAVINTANDVRRRVVLPLVKLFDSIGKTTVRDITTALYNFLCELKVREQIELQATECRNNKNFAEEKELIQLWNILIGCFDTIVNIAGDVVLGGDEYINLISIVFDNTDIGTIPPCIDNVVLGSASNFRTGNVKHVYLLGVNEGVFPKLAEENCIFNDSEKSILRGLDVELSGGTSEITEDELFWFYKAVSTANESLTLTYAESDLLGAAGKISVAGARVNYLLNDKPIVKYFDMPYSEKTEGKSIALKHLSLNRDNELGVALAELYSENEKTGYSVNSFDEPLDAGVSDIDLSVARDIYKGNINSNQSKIDSYVKCSFAYHCRHVLSLNEKKKAVFRGGDIGSFVHVVLERFISRITVDGKLRCDIEEDEIISLIEEIINDYIKSACQGISEQSPRILQMFRRLKRTTVLLIRNILDEFKESDFVPTLFEFPIMTEKEGGLPSYEIGLDDGTKMFMRGMVDRVDTYKKGNDVYIRIVDYKTGTQDFSLDDIEKGLNLQMLIYLFAIWNTKDRSFKERINCSGDIIPAGVLYFSASAPSVKIEKEDDLNNVYSNASKSIKRKGLLINDIDVLRAMEKGLNGEYIPVKLYKNGNLSNSQYLHTLEEFGALSKKIDKILNDIAMNMKSGKVSAAPIDMKDDKKSPCVYCKFKPICRHLTKEDEDE